MNLFQNRDPSEATPPWKEWCIQAYIVMELRRAGYTVHGDGNGLSLTPKGIMQKKVCGAHAGWPDMAVLLNGGRVLWIELKIISTQPKRTRKGRVSSDQSDMALTMERLGHRYEVVWASCPTMGLSSVMELLLPYGAPYEWDLPVNVSPNHNASPTATMYDVETIGSVGHIVAKSENV